MRTVKSKQFWIGVAVGALVVPMVVRKVNVKVPAQTA